MDATAAVSDNLRIPLAAIADARRSFPRSALEFELILNVVNALEDLAACATVFSRAGLACVSLRYCGDGDAFFKLRVDRSADLSRFNGNST